MEISAPQHSSEHSYHFFPGRGPVFSLPKTFDSLNESAINLSQRRNKANPYNVDKKQFELDIDWILEGEDKRTVLMIKNIPNKYTSKILLSAIDEHCQGTYDFLYLPIDFKNKCNVGYAFINMIDPSQIAPFYQELFPMGTNIQSRSGRKENHNQGSSSAPASREDNFGGVESTSGSSKDSD